MKKIKNYLNIFTAIFIVVFSILPSFGGNSQQTYIVKNTSGKEIETFTKDFAKSFNYEFASNFTDNSFYIFTETSKVNNFTVSTLQLSNDSEVTVTIPPLTKGNNAHDIAQTYIQYLLQTYSQAELKPKLTNIYKNEKEKQETVNQLKKQTMLNLVGNINTSKYAPIDPEFTENMDLIKNAIHNKGEKKLSYNVAWAGKIPEMYSVTKGTERLSYDSNGNLLFINTCISNAYPSVNYAYNYPEGLLVNFDIAFSENDIKSFDHTGEKLAYTDYMKNLQKKIVTNWTPPKTNTSSTIVALFKLNKMGEITNLKVLKSSGNPDCDDLALKAIKRAAPFNGLPPDSALNSIDICFTFNYNVQKAMGSKSLMAVSMLNLFNAIMLLSLL